MMAERDPALILSETIIEGLKTLQRKGVETMVIYLGQREWYTLRRSDSTYIQYAMNMNGTTFCGVPVVLVYNESHFNICGDTQWKTTSTQS